MRFFKLILAFLHLVGWAVSAHGQELKFIDVPERAQVIRDHSRLADIVNRCFGLNRPVLGYSRSTNAHESTHMLDASLKNQYGGQVFYVLDGKAIRISEPHIRKSLAAEFIPQCLRESRYRTYISGQTAFEHEPTYVWEEWGAYINGTLTALESPAQHKNTDEAVGPLEMGLYSVAVAMAVEKYEPQHFISDPQFLPCLKYQMGRAKSAYDQAAPLFPFSTQDRILANLRTSPSAKPMREWITKNLDGVWLK